MKLIKAGNTDFLDVDEDGGFHVLSTAEQKLMK